MLVLLLDIKGYEVNNNAFKYGLGCNLNRKGYGDIICLFIFYIL